MSRSARKGTPSKLAAFMISRFKGALRGDIIILIKIGGVSILLKGDITVIHPGQAEPAEVVADGEEGEAALVEAGSAGAACWRPEEVGQAFVERKPVFLEQRGWRCLSPITPHHHSNTTNIATPPATTSTSAHHDVCAPHN